MANDKAVYQGTLRSIEPPIIGPIPSGQQNRTMSLTIDNYIGTAFDHVVVPEGTIDEHSLNKKVKIIEFYSSGDEPQHLKTEIYVEEKLVATYDPKIILYKSV